VDSEKKKDMSIFHDITSKQMIIIKTNCNDYIIHCKNRKIVELMISWSIPYIHKEIHTAKTVPTSYLDVHLEIGIDG
jgi:hypothetical protein